MNKTDKILVTGASGMVGTALLNLLEKEGYVNVFTMPSSGRVDLLDMGKTLAYFQAVEPDYVFHLAAKVAGIGGNMKDQNAAFVQNVIINTNVVEACRLMSVKKVIAMGSGAVYAEFYHEENDIWKNKPHPSEYGYAQAKRMMLAHLEICKQQYRMNYAYIVSANLYGPHDRFNIETGHVVPSLIAKFHEAKMTNTPVPIWGTGIAARDFMHVDDMAQALMKAAATVSGPINVGSGSNVTIGYIVELLSRITGVHNIAWESLKPNGVHDRVYDLKKLQATGFRAKILLQDGLQKLWDWYCAHHEKVRK